MAPNSFLLARDSSRWNFDRFWRSLFSFILQSFFLIFGSAFPTLSLTLLARRQNPGIDVTYTPDMFNQALIHWRQGIRNGWQRTRIIRSWYSSKTFGWSIEQGNNPRNKLRYGRTGQIFMYQRTNHCWYQIKEQPLMSSWTWWVKRTGALRSLMHQMEHERRL